jgi:hypothetical protein
LEYPKKNKERTFILGLEWIGVHMASQATIDANRRNARKSTGPKTRQGKSVAKMNALKHGLTAEQVVIPGENPAEFDEMRRKIYNEFQPVGWRETELVDRISSLVWRVRRVSTIEAGIFAFQCGKIELERARREVSKLELSESLTRISLMGTDEEIEQARNQEEDAERTLDKISKSLAAAFIEDARSEDALSKLSRREILLERSLSQTFAEIERLQSDRKVQNGSGNRAPVTIDMKAEQEADTS